MAQPVARHVEAIQQAMRPFFTTMTGSAYAHRQHTEGVADFMAGNPQELALPGFVAALTRWSVPQDKEWFAYKRMDPRAQEAAAAGLSGRLGMEFDPADIFLARGASGGLALALRTVVDPGDEVLFVSPPWFFYEAMIIAAGATPVRVRMDPTTFDLDLDAITGALTERTRAILVNTPHNPTGKIYPPKTLERLAAFLSAASERNGRPIYILADEAYNRILFDGLRFHSPGRFYPYSFLVQTYSKSALAPGQRLGYVALPPTMPDRARVRLALLTVAFGHSHHLPDAVMQYALPEIEALSIDLDHLQHKRDRMVAALRDLGYDLHVPESTFYLLPRSPITDDVAFTDFLARRDVFVLPGTALEMPGYFRLSLTATDAMIDRALPVFAAAVAEADRPAEPKRIDATTLTRTLPAEAIPLSSAQQRLWSVDQQTTDGSAKYNLPLAVRLVGPLHVEALERSLNALVCRHDALRATFTTMNGQPVQVIASELTVPLPIVNLEDWPKDEREAEVARLAHVEAQHVFDLARGPLVRVQLLRLSAEEYILLLTVHHIVSDAWSMGIFNRELAVLYDAYAHGHAATLPALPIQYAEFARRQHERMQGEALTDLLTYWQQQLSGAPAALELPTDYPRRTEQSWRGARETLVLSPVLSEVLRDLSQQEGATPFMTLLAAFQVLLARYTGQEDIVVGTPTSGRAYPETENLIGLFANTLVLRTDLSGTPTFQEVLQRVRRVVVDANAHQELPFEQLERMLCPVPGPARTALVDVLFDGSGLPQTVPALSGLTVQTLELTEPQAKVPITLYEHDEGDVIRLQLVYQRELFSPERAVCILRQFRYLLEQIVAAPDSRVQSYSLVTPEWQEVLPSLEMDLLEPRYPSVSRMFLEAVARARDHPAICQADNSWTYGQLAHGVYSTIRELRAQGVTAGDVVAVTGPRSCGFVAGMLAVLMSGGVLLTIDRHLPVNRQRLMLEEAQCRHILYIGAWRPDDAWMRDVAGVVIMPSETQPSTDTLDNTAILPDLAPNDAAYIFFTSGTTGIPKGILGCHKGLSHFLRWQREQFAVGAHDRAAQLTSLSFDVVLRDVLLPLTSGATLCLPDDPDDFSADRILPWLDRERITLLHTVPTLARTWLAAVPAELSLRYLRTVFFAGEPLSGALVRRWRDAFPEAGEIVNLYGPTETTLAKCFYVVPRDVSAGVQPVGWPLPFTQALVLADNYRLCGVGEKGEIVIRTPFRTLGYINASRDTAQRFVRNPLTADNGDKLYRTGDLGRYRPDGALEILGRLDQQIKIRGIRVEPGEIEVVLSQHPTVREAVVVAREDVPGDKGLVAYLVPSPDAPPSAEELRQYLRQRLPDYMVPAAFVPLEALPLTPNGKIDRRALPALAPPTQSDGAGRHVAPRDELERRLATIWERELKIAPISISDNFFHLGGHSLVAVRIFSQIEKVLGTRLPVATLFTAQTIEQLAAILRQEGWAPGQDMAALCSDRPTSLVTVRETARGAARTMLHALLKRRL